MQQEMQSAVAGIVQADAQARIAGAALLPTINATASAERSRTPGTVTGGRAIERTLYMTALNASYQIDFWGRVRALIRAADYASLASRFDREVVALSSLVSVANTYFVVLEGQDRLRIARENLASSERILKLIEDRFNQGTSSALEVAQQASLTAIVRASIPPLIEQIEQNKAALALLVG